MDETTTRPGPEDLLAHAGFVRGLARALVHDPWRADDLSQEAMAVALRSPPAHSGNLRAWFSRLLRNLLRTARRSDRRRAAREERAGRPGTAPAAADVAADLEVQRRLVDAVAGLDEPFRTAVVLRFFHGLSPAEISQRTGVPAKTVSSRLSRALARLRETLDREHGGRRAWTAALVPLLAAPRRTPLLFAGGAVVSGKLLAAGAAAAVLLVTGVFVLPGPRGPDRPDSPPLPSPEAGDRRDEPVTIVLRGDPDEPASEDRGAPPAPAAARAGEEASSTPEEVVWELEVTVVDADAEPYAGARIQFRNEEDECVAEARADAEGQTTIRVREAGTIVAFGNRPGWHGTRAWTPPGRGASAGAGFVRVTIRDPDPLGTPPPGERNVRGGAGGLFGGRGGHRNLRAEGGGAKTQSAADLALQWLSERQFDGGSWENRVTETSLALLAYLGGGYTHRYGPYRETVHDGLLWLLARRGGDGRFSDDRAENALATLAVLEAWGLVGSVRLEEAAEGAVEAIARSSVPVDPLVALREGHALLVADEIGLPVPVGALDDRRRVLLGRQSAADGAVTGGPEIALTGGLLFLVERSRHPAGGTPEFRAGLRFTRAALTDEAPDGPLDAHYGCLGVFQAGGEDWKAVNEAVLRALPESQVREEGRTRGSWEPDGGLSRVAVTALNAATLEVYYRYSRRL